jgi:hypothetical protein
MNLTMSFKMKFNAQAVLSPAQRAERKLLNYMGGYVRTVAKNSIRKGGAPHTASPPNTAPFTHAGSLGQNLKGKLFGYKDFIFYAYDAAKRAVFIGPVLLRGRAGPLICQTLEFGGAELIWIPRHGKQVQVMANFLPRPHMRPALVAVVNSPKFADALKDCVVNEAGTSAAF